MILTVNNSYTKVTDCDAIGHKAIWEALSYRDKNVDMIRRKTGNYSIDPMKSFYDRRSHTFLSGLLDKVKVMLEQNKIEYQVREINKVPNLVLFDHDIKDITYYDYQEEAIQKFVQEKRGVLKLSTGAGKTIIAKGIVKGLNVPTLFLTHRTNLLRQTHRRFLNRLPEFKDKFGLIGDGEYSPNYITFAMAQTIYSMLKREDDEIQKVLKMFRLVVVDEAHRMKSDQFSASVAACVNADYRCGLTATPFMRKDEHENMALQGGIGGIICEVGNETLVNQGVLAKPYVKFIKVDQPQDMSHFQEYFKVYKYLIIQNQFRNQKIVDATKAVMTARPHLLTIVTSLTHGRILQEMYTKANITSEFCHGDMTSKEREEVLNRLATGQIDVVIATQIFDEGQDIKEIGGVILAAGGKSPVANLQRVGRSMRKKDENYCIIVDFYDTTHHYLARHSKQRWDLFNNDPSFTILNQKKELK